MATPINSNRRISLKRSELLMDIRRMAASRLQEKGPSGKLSGQDVKALLARAYQDGGMTNKKAADLDFVQNHYKDQMDTSASSLFHDFSSAMIADTQDQIREQEKEASAERAEDMSQFQEFLVEDHQEHSAVTRDQKVKALEDRLANVTDREKVTLVDLFGQKND